MYGEQAWMLFYISLSVGPIMMYSAPLQSCVEAVGAEVSGSALKILISVSGLPHNTCRQPHCLSTCLHPAEADPRV